jgi:hypothetical protein
MVPGQIALETERSVDGDFCLTKSENGATNILIAGIGAPSHNRARRGRLFETSVHNPPRELAADQDFFFSTATH